ncbi:hypothetical protein [Arenimonas sp.]|uniref:hypothetical protein n=1 Tax=Arenimonas sp. TaxID=1872635 RepID=UPI0039E4F29D
MTPHRMLLLAPGLIALAACSRTIDIADHDGKALAAAIHAANADAGKTTIRLAKRGMYVIDAPAEPGLLLPSVRGHIEIQGNGAEIRAYTDQPVALLQVETKGELRLQSLSLAEGSDGAIRNFGELEFERVSIVDSSAQRANAIVLNHGTLHAEDSRIAYNGLSPALRDAGTVLNYGRIELDRSAIHDNYTLGKYPSLAVAGGVLNYGELRVDGLTMANNNADNGGDLLSTTGILNLGNGRVSGDIASIRETLPVAALGR